MKMKYRHNKTGAIYTLQYSDDDSAWMLVGKEIEVPLASYRMSKMTLAEELNPIYAAYCKAHGNEIWEQMIADRAEYSGKSMTGYIIWVGGMRMQYAKLHPDQLIGDKIMDLDHWTNFLVSSAEGVSRP